MRKPERNPQLERRAAAHALLSVCFISSVSLCLLTCDREDLCTHLWPSTSYLTACTVMSYSLIIRFFFFLSFHISLSSCQVTPPVMLLHFSNTLTSVSLMSKVVFRFSCVSLVFRFPSFLLMPHRLGFVRFPCSTSFSYLEFYFFYGHTSNSPFWKSSL